MRVKIACHNICVLSAILFGSVADAQTQNALRNLDFEYLDSYGAPISWRPQFTGKGPRVSLSNIAYSGNQCAVIENYYDSTKSALFNTVILEKDFKGKKAIVVKGYIKTENFHGSAASFWMEMKGGSRNSGVNSDAQSPQGTSDWKQYSITISIDADAKMIAFGCKMKGTGQVKFDKLEVLLDGRPLE